MVKPRPPPLYRLSRALRIASVIAVVVIVIYLGLAVYSLLQLDASDVSGVNQLQPSYGNGSASLALNIVVKNPGALPVNSVNVNASVQLANHTPLANIGLPTVTINESGTGEFPFVFTVDFTHGGPAQTLLFHDNNLWVFFRLTATYAYLFNADVGAWGRFAWGAPFYGLNLTAGAPVSNPNGTVSIPVTATFTNHARFAVPGNLSATLSDPSGATCGTVHFPLGVGAGQAYGHTDTWTSSPSCASSASAILLTWVSGPSLTIVFPPEPFA